MALYPDLPARPEAANPQAIVVNPQLKQNAQMTVQSFAMVHPQGMSTSRLSRSDLHKRLGNLLQLKCPCCIKDLIAQGHKFLKEGEEEVALHGIFYLATAYELYRTLNVQEYKLDRQALDEYLDSLEKRLENEEALLHYFAAYENRSIFIYLFAERQNIKGHLDVLAGTSVKETPLHVAIRVGAISIARFLLEQGADFKKLDSCQNNTLHHACQSQQDCVDIVRILLRCDSTLMEAKNSAGQTPLHLAALAGNAKSLEYLLDQIADTAELGLQDKEGNTPLHLAIMGWSETSIKGKDHYCKIVGALIKKGSNLTLLNKEKKTALALACGNKAIIQVLVQAKLSPQILAGALQSFYLSQEILSIFRIKAEQEWEFKVPLEEIYVRLGIIESKERKARDQALNKHSGYLQHERIPTYESIFEPKKNIEIEKLFEHESLKGKDRKRIYLQGAAGSGKSTLCHYIAYRWAKKDLWQGLFAYLFWIPLRNLTLRKYPADKEYTPADLIAKEYAGKVDPRVIKACISDPAFRKETLLILDGYDELSSDVQAKTSLATAFKELKELFPHILITSRPGSCSFNRSCELELLGFDKEGIGRYIDRFFEQVQTKEKKVTLHRLLKISPDIASLARIPIHLTLLCCLFNEDSEFFNSKQPITLVAIYERMVNWMYKWFMWRRIDQGLSSQTKEKILEEKNLRHNREVAKIANIFEGMAFTAMERDTLYLEKGEVDRLRGIEITSNELIDCGLMRIPDEERGYFIHLTFQEFLTASKVANQYLNRESQACQEFVRNYKVEPRYALVLRMIAGYLSFIASSNRCYLNSNALQSFFDDLFAAPQDLAISSELTLIAECFEECQDPSLVKQYNGFIELVKDYIKHICLLGLGFERLLRNKNLFTHPEIVSTIRELLSDSKTTVNMLNPLISVVRSGISLSSEIVGLIVKKLKDPKKDSDAKKYATVVLLEVARQGGELPKEVLTVLIQTFKEGDALLKKHAVKALKAIAKQRSELSKEVPIALIQTFKERDSITKVCAASVLKAMAKQGDELPKEVLAVLIQTFKECDVLLKEYAVKALKAMIKQGSELSEEALIALIQALKESDSTVKVYAASALKGRAKQGDELSKEMLAALIQALKEGDSTAKVRALRTVAKQGDELSKELLAALIQTLKKGDALLKEHAAIALEAIVKQGNELSKELLAALIQALREGDRTTKRYAARVLKAMTKQGNELSKEVLAALIQALQEGDSKIKGHAARVLKAMTKQGSELSKEVLVALIQAFNEDYSEAKSYVARALKEIVKQEGDLSKEALTVLIQALEKGDSKTKSYAAEALKEIIKQEGDLSKEALTALIQALEKGDSKTKSYAAEALGKIVEQGGELPKEALVALIQVFNESDSIAKVCVVRALEAIAIQKRDLPKESLATLAQALKESGSMIKSCAAGALGTLAKQGGELSKEALTVLIQALKEGDSAAKTRAAYFLGEMAEQEGELSEEALAALIQALKEGDDWTKLCAIRALKIVKQESVLLKEISAAFIRAFKDSKLKTYAANTLKAIAIRGGEIPEEVLATLIQTLKEDNNLIKHPAAIITLEAIAEQKGELPKEALVALVQTLKQGNDLTKRSAAEALEAIAKQGGEHCKEALAALIQGLKKGDSRTKDYAARALKKVDKVILLKMGSEAFALIAKVCFLTENCFSIKGLQLQISDKRVTYLGKDRLTFTYEEIREKLPEKLAVWRESLDNLSTMGSF
ncbi:HEAT repeat domain-containing protein [Parachlamydia sp. AcF125]|uniref:HEAT repeat domain-containing protein n=1 Tax=Parachlamydia sp. AcF125 TaxID=2795736 RepID=UPI001BC9F3E3|nr:HEAT repeat domain-containing protein [Parachlamydia sp. AcF125]MBS4168306.1 Phosphocholine transferase AnkX [Parachlamydia sp. AcF125]